jgi:hypothetical protein
MCSHCGSWGLRYKLPTQKEWQRRCKKSQAFAKLGPQPRPIIEKGGDWFICSQVDCKRQGGQKRFTLNADANAARNLLIRAFRSDWWGVSTLDEVERNAKEQEINDYLQGKVTFLEKQLTFTLASS